MEGGPLINVFLRVYFDLVRQRSRVGETELVIYFFGVFIGIIGGGTSVKRIREGLF